jgi:hypothetical protein
LDEFGCYTEIQNMQNIHTFSRPIYDPSTADPQNNKKEQYKIWTSLTPQTSGYQQHSKAPEMFWFLF